MSSIDESLMKSTAQAYAVNLRNSTDPVTYSHEKLQRDTSEGLWDYLKGAEGVSFSATEWKKLAEEINIYFEGQGMIGGSETVEELGSYTVTVKECRFRAGCIYCEGKGAKQYGCPLLAVFSRAFQENLKAKDYVWETMTPDNGSGNSEFSFSLIY